jgi:hypothetical protein
VAESTKSRREILCFAQSRYVEFRRVSIGLILKGILEADSPALACYRLS